MERGKNAYVHISGRINKTFVYPWAPVSSFFLIANVPNVYRIFLEKKSIFINTLKIHIYACDLISKIIHFIIYLSRDSDIVNKI